MKCLVSLFLSFTIFILKISCDEFLAEYDDYYQISSYKFFPKLEDCYEIYNQNEKITSFTCQRQADLEKQTCIDWIPSDKYCLGLKTPTNETVEFICKDTPEELDDLYHYDLNSCFKVYNVDKTFREVCQQNFDNYSIGITTPDNFTVMFESYFCKTFMSIDERKTFNNFVNNYSFDPGLKSCYKVFNPNQIVSPYTCLNKDIYESCIHELPKNKNCMGIITQNNETLILDCADSGENSSSTRNCFKIYTSDDNVHVACQKKIEERCVGITTPSNLTVLLDCYYCSTPNGKNTRYDNAEDRRKYRDFVKSYLNKEYKGENSYLETIDFEVFEQSDFVEPPDCSGTKPKVYAYWLPNTNCYGLTLESNETIILGCTSKEKELKPGCFQVVNSDQETTTVCVSVLDERCVGITTPKNLSVVLACYPLNKCSHNSDWEESYANKPAEHYGLFPQLDTCYEVYDENQEVSPYNCRKKAKPESYACIDWIMGKKDCLGLKTPQNETIELRCTSIKDPFALFPTSSCFNVYSPEGNVKRVCQKKFGNYSIGITTPINNSILFDSYFCQTYKPLQEIKAYKQFIENFSFDPDVRSCYKIFAQDQEISPYSCLSRDVHEACIHQLNDSNCVGIKTQNNETVVLHCSNVDEERNLGCFKIYTPDNKVHSACQRQLEESCIGITTPSNLSVLFECHTCLSTRGNLHSYQNPFRKKLRKFVESALHNYTHGNYAIKDSYQVFTEKDNKEKEIVHLLRGHNNCRGLTLKNFETVVLECPDKIPEKNGCFDIYSSKYDEIRNGPEQKVQSVCIKVLDERCVGIITPNNWTLALDCIFEEHILQPVSAIVVPHNGMPPRM